MPYRLKPDTMYMIPTHFGPMAGPRQGPGGKQFTFGVDRRRSRTYAVSFLTHQDQVEALLPERFAVVGEPVVTVAETLMTEIDWLAGRGYNVLGVTFGAYFNGERDRASGPFLLVLWENLTDPILTGREQLGFAKIYCELPEPVVHGGETHCTASWLGFRFMDMKLTNIAEIAPPDVTAPPEQAGSASGVYSTSRYFASIVGSSVLAAVLGSGAGSTSRFGAIFLMVVIAAFLSMGLALGLRGRMTAQAAPA